MRIVSTVGLEVNADSEHHHSYLFSPNGTRAIRPVIESAPSKASVGGTLIATTDSPVTAWAMLRLGATTRKYTHTTDVTFHPYMDLFNT